jgi:hypothetical protein
MSDESEAVTVHAGAEPDVLPAEVVALAHAFVAAACDGTAGVVLYSLLAADAPVFCDAEWRHRGQEDEAALASRHARLHFMGAPALPDFQATRATSWHPEGDGASGVIWFEAHEERTGTPVVGAIGVRISGGWRVAWAVLAERVESWSFADGLVRSLAQLSWMNLREPAIARTALDASFFRLHWLTAQPITALPETRFTCRASTTCCRQDYVVAAPAAAQALIDALPWERIAPRLQHTRLRPLSDGQVEIKGRSDACRFLGARHECLIHAELGYQPFAPCAAFPFSFAATPDGVAVTGSMTCGSICDAFGATVTERDQDLRQRSAIAPLRTASQFRLAPGRVLEWRDFHAAESLLIQLLALESLPLHRRLYLGARALAAVDAGEAIELDGWQQLPGASISAALREQLGGFLDNIMGWDRIALRDLPMQVPRDLRHADLQGSSRLATTLRGLHFSKVYSYEFDLVTANNLAIVVYLLALAWQRAGTIGMDELRWRELALLSGHGLLRSLLANSAPSGMRELLGSPEFGELALAFAAG